MADCSNEIDYIIELLKGNKPNSSLPDFDTEFIIKYSVQNGLGPYLYNQLKRNDAAQNQEFFKQFKRSYIQTLALNTNLFNTLQDVNQIFSDLGVEFVVLKGGGLSPLLYNDIALRPMSDLDIWVLNFDYALVEKAMTKCGFTNVYPAKTQFMISNNARYHFEFKKGNLLVEIHRLLDANFQVNSPDVFPNLMQVEYNGMFIPTFKPEFQLFHLCFHSAKHFAEGILRMNSLLDIYLLIEKFKNDLNWDLVNNLSIKYEKQSDVCTALTLVSKVFYKDYLPVSLAPFIRNDVWFNNLLQLRNPVKKTDIENLATLKKVRGFGNKFRFLTGDLFPDFTYMKHRYGIKSRASLFVYYPYRVLTGVAKLFHFRR